MMEEYQKSQFSIPDYVVFGAMLLASSVIGIYFACGGKQSSTREYLMAGRDMSWFPIFVSLLASYLSAITLLGVPSEIYTYGLQYIVLCFSYFILITVAAVIFLPLFYKLQIVSANEYLEKRFTPGVRSLGCCLFMLQYILYLSVVLYAPSLALEAGPKFNLIAGMEAAISLAGVPIWATIVSTGLVCTFYTTLGGMKAVIWTDVFQAAVMVTGLIVVMIVGVVELDGFEEVFRRAKEGERLNVFDFNPDPRIRNTFWTLAIGGAFTAMPVWTVSQPAVQRFQAAKSLRESKKALYFNIPGLIIIVLLCVIDGIVIYGVYAYCDIGKFGIGIVKSNDQVLPYFIIDRLGKYKGIPGLFTSCLFSGALSTASSGLNSMAAVALEDIVKKIKPDISDATSTKVSKLIACAIGLLIVGLAFAVSALGTMVLQLAYSIFGIVGGPYLGVFLLGIMVKWSNWKGAYCGTFVGVAVTLWLAIGANIYPPNKYEAVVRVTQCSGFLNRTNTSAEIFQGSGIIRPIDSYKELVEEKNYPPESSWYSISYLWYAAIAISFTFVSGMLFSLIFKIFEKDNEDEKSVNPDLLFDYEEFFHSLIPRCFTSFRHKVKMDDQDYELGDKSKEAAKAWTFSGDAQFPHQEVG